MAFINQNVLEMLEVLHMPDDTADSGERDAADLFPAH